MSQSVCSMRILTAVALLVSGGLQAAPQTETRPGPDDWEQINFITDSAVITDGHPSLLRLARLLKDNPNYSLQIIGYTDETGRVSHNEKLGQQRAEAVQQYLLGHGANPAQTHAISGGISKPERPPAGVSGYGTREVRWINRRVELSITDAQGQPVLNVVPKKVTLAPLQVDSIVAGATSVTGSSPLPSGVITISINGKDAGHGSVDASGKFEVKLANPAQAGNFVTVTSSEDPALTQAVEVKSPPALPTPQIVSWLQAEDAQLTGYAASLSGTVELWINGKDSGERAIAKRGSVEFKGFPALAAGDAVQLRETLGGRTVESAVVTVQKRLARLTVATVPHSGDAKISGRSPVVNATVKVMVNGADSGTGTTDKNGVFNIDLNPPLALGNLISFTLTGPDGASLAVQEPITVSEPDFSDIDIDFLQPKENETLVSGIVHASKDELAKLKLAVDLHNGSDHVYHSADVTLDKDTGTFSAKVPSLAETQTVHVVAMTTDDNRPRRIGEATVGSAGYDWGRVKAYFSLGGVMAREDGKFGATQPYLALNIDYNVYNSSRKKKVASQATPDERQVIFQNAIKQLEALKSRKASHPEDALQTALHSAELARILEPIKHQPCKAVPKELQNIIAAAEGNTGKGAAPDSSDDCTAARKTVLVNAYFEGKWTSVPTGVLNGQPANPSTSDASTTKDTATSTQVGDGASVEAGIYAPVYTSWSQWSFKGRRNALFFAPIGKLGFQALSESDLQGKGTINGREVYRFLAGGVRFGHMTLPEDAAAEAPGLISYLDLAIGRWDNFRLYKNSETQTGPPYRWPLRFDAQGRFKIPWSPFFVGFDANVGPGADDFRFIFGARIDIGKLLGRLVPTIQ
jgi:hypothetical protein